jgi:hypothetical protein
MERDKEADLLGLAAGFVVAPTIFGVLGAWMYPLFRSAGDPIHQVYTLPEIGIGLVGGGVIGLIVGATLLYVRSKTETPEEHHEH